ncbi:hypothetical protein [Deinococcus pimensis]|uniref:hypothetical protein n=1 Tax=Deinococcus pimensis TaxID=309888 RepID=UPI0004B0CDD4|nr:hypothetical protein [Deinococcus pimensis]
MTEPTLTHPVHRTDGRAPLIAYLGYAMTSSVRFRAVFVTAFLVYQLSDLLLWQRWAHG